MSRVRAVMLRARPIPGALPRGRRGGIMVLLVAMFPLVLVCAALCIDVGRAVARKQQLIHACDAAAFAAATQMPNQTRASKAAKEVFAATFSAPIYSTTVTSSSIVTSAEEAVPTAFARVAGVNTIRVSALTRMVIQTQPPNEVRGGITPWAVEYHAYETGAEVSLKLSGGSGSNGNFYALALGGTGASVYLGNLKYGYPGTLGTGDNLAAETEPGAITGPTREGVEYRIALAAANPAYANDTFDNYSSTNPRILIVPMISSWLDASGRTNLDIVGFAAFYLVGMQGNDVRGRFVQVALRSAVYNPARPDAMDFGVYSTEIVE